MYDGRSGALPRESVRENDESTRRADYRLGSLYSLATAVLLATQEPFSALAARRFSSPQFICLMQFALLLSVPLLTLPAASRRDFVALLSDVRNLGKLAILFIIGLCGLFLYNIGLSSAHPIITAAILNLSPFWAALVAMLISGKSIPVSPLVFFGCFATAFVGAMIVAWSQDRCLQSDSIQGSCREPLSTPVGVRDTDTDIFRPERDTGRSMVLGF